jgi:hypothetical protein
MATRTQPTPHFDNLTQIVHLWNRRLRWRQTILLLPYALIPGLMLGISINLVSRFRIWLSNGEIVMVAVGLMLVGVGLMTLAVWLYPRKAISSARRFDQQFLLKERVSTALELIEGRIRSHEELRGLQLDDALAEAQAIRPESELPFENHSTAWIVVALLGFMLVILSILPNTNSDQVQQNAAQQQAIAASADDLRDAIEDVAADTTLDEATREELLETLQSSLETLEDEKISEDEALATLNDVQELLNEEAGNLQEQANQEQAALDAANEALQDAREQTDRPPEEVGSSGDQSGDLLDDISKSLPEMSPEQAAQTAQALEQAASVLEETSPEAAQSLRDAAESLRDGDTQAAQEALEQSREQIKQAQERQQQNQESGESLSQNSEEVAEAQSDISESGEQPPSDGDQSSQQSGEQDGEAPPQEGEGSPGGEDEGGNQPSDAEGNEPPSSASDAEGSRPGEQSPLDAQTGEGGAEGNPDTQIGDQAGNLSEDTSGAMEDTGEEQQGASGDGTEAQYEEIFAPRRPNVQGGNDQLQLEPDTQDTPLSEGDLSENPEGRATVPYNEVFSDYANAANEAVDQDYIPLGLRDVVRQYFTSLAPRGSQRGN